MFITHRILPYKQFSESHMILNLYSLFSERLEYFHARLKLLSYVFFAISDFNVGVCSRCLTLYPLPRCQGIPPTISSLVKVSKKKAYPSNIPTSTSAEIANNEDTLVIRYLKCVTCVFHLCYEKCWAGSECNGYRESAKYVRNFVGKEMLICLTGWALFHHSFVNYTNRDISPVSCDRQCWALLNPDVAYLREVL